MKKRPKYSVSLFTIIIILVLVFIFLPPFLSTKRQSNGYDKLKLISKGMSKSEMIDTFGEPQVVIGSGLDIYVFTTESYTIQAGFGNDKIMYASLLNKDGTLKQKIIY